MSAIKKIKILPREKWAVIPGKKTVYKEIYAISNYGRLVKYRSAIKEGSILNCSRQQGYPIWRYRNKGQYCHELIHKLVAKFFLPKPLKNEVFVTHLDFDKENNHYKNLKWVSQEGLTRHAFNNPVIKKAKKKRLENIGAAYNTKLTEAKVRKIKELLLKMKTLKELAIRFKVSDMQIHRIKTGENWGHLK